MCSFFHCLLRIFVDPSKELTPISVEIKDVLMNYDLVTSSLKKRISANSTRRPLFSSEDNETDLFSLFVELSEIFTRSYDKFICFYNSIFCFSTEHRQSHIFLIIVKHFTMLLSTYIIVIYEILIRANENLITIIHIV